MCKNVAAAMLGLAAVMLPAAQAPAPVAGFVFEDVNGNGRRDSGERGLAGVAISNQHEVVESGADGAYRLTGPGSGVVFVSLPDDHRAVGTFWKVVPSASSSAPLDFALAARSAPTTLRSSTRRTRTSVRKASFACNSFALSPRLGVPISSS